MIDETEVDPWDVEDPFGDADPVSATAIEAPPERFAAAYAELVDIAAQLKPTQDRVPDVDALEPKVRRARVLAAFCRARIEAVRLLVEDT